MIVQLTVSGWQQAGAAATLSPRSGLFGITKRFCNLVTMDLQLGEFCLKWEKKNYSSGTGQLPSALTEGIREP